MIRVRIEVVADDREDAVSLLKDAVRLVSRAKESSGETVNSCIGDYRITLEEPDEPETPFVQGDLVRCLDRESAYFGCDGSVVHSGPQSSGVNWRGWRDRDAYNIRPNIQLCLLSGPRHDPCTANPEAK